MKNIILAMVVLLASCKTGKQRAYVVYTSVGTGWNSSSINIRCDSVKLITPKHACIYIDGTATDIFADQILVGN